MGQLLNRVFRKCGMEMMLQQGAREWRFRGMLQPSRSQSLQNARWQLSPLGQLPSERYVYIGPAVPLPQPGDILTCRGAAYELRQAERVMLGSRALYCWGLCVRKGDAQ